MESYAYKNPRTGEWEIPMPMRSRFLGFTNWHEKTDEERVEFGWYPCTLINAEEPAYGKQKSVFPEVNFDGVTKKW